MKAALACGWLLLAAACGAHDTPVATYNAPLPSVSGGGAAIGSGGSGGSAPEPACMQTYPTIPEGLTSRYKEVTTGQIWVAAERDCESEGGHLIVIDDDAENLFMAQVAAKAMTNNKSSHQLSWIGRGDHSTEGEFRWITGAALNLEPWADSEPNSLFDDEDCVEIRASGMWNDDRCDAKLTYVCECDGASAADGWCDTSAVATCGDCSTACLPEQVCIDQQCM